MITLQEYKTFVKKANPADDETLTQLIASCSSVIKGYCGKTFTHNTNNKYESFAAVGSNKIILTDTPVESITEVLLNGEDVTDRCKLDKRTDIIIFDALFVEGDFLEVTYVSGYTSIPHDIKLAVIKLVEHYFDKQYIQRKANGQSNVQNFFLETEQWPKHILVLLENYRDVI